MPTCEWPEAFAGHLRVNAAREQVGRMGVAEIMEADARQSRPARSCLPCVRQASRLERLTVLPRIDEGGVLLPDAEPQ